jgi:hypothetical protein
MFESFNAMTTPTSVADHPSGTSSKKDSLKGLSYAQGRAALTPSAMPPASVQMDAATNTTTETQEWTGRLTSREERSATRYNRARGLPVTTVKRYQSCVRTGDDGSFGPNTAEAIARFQEEHGLTVDGKLGPQTQASIEEVMAQSSQAHAPLPGQTTDEQAGGSGAPPEGPHGPSVSSAQLSASFSLSEFGSRDGAQTPVSVIPALRELATQLEVLKRALGGAALHINSGYRSPNHNRNVGGATNSQHLYGRAADISVSGYSPRQVADKIDELMRAGTMKHGGLGRYNTFTHIDTRGYMARW